MRTRALIAGLALALSVGIIALVGGGDPDPTAVPQVVATTGAPEQDHVDDYSAPASELIDHIDHLDLDRLPPETRAELEAELARRKAIAEGLWAAYGELVAGDPEADPSLVRALPVYELAYVLTAARAEQLAVAVARTGSLDAARVESGKDHREVTVTLSGGCVTVTYAKDPFRRAFGARVGGSRGGPLRERLEQAVQVGAAGTRACGGSQVVLSPDAAVALGD